MAQCKHTPQEIIKNAFTPQVAVMCSPLAEQTCQKNNLSFIDLLQPFCKLGAEAHYKDPFGNVVTIRNLKITIQDVSARPPQTTLARKFLKSSVSSASEPRFHIVNLGEYSLDVPLATPWFESWRDTFLRVQFPSDHEFTKHFLACILVVSSEETNPVESIVRLSQTLNQMQSVAPSKVPKWFHVNMLRYYVVVHDNTDGSSVLAVQTFDSVKASYGSNNCFLLRMNSRSSGQNGEQLPDPWSQFLSNRIQSEETTVSAESSPGVSRSTVNTIEVAQEISESSHSTTYHPLSPVMEDNSMSESFSDKDVNSVSDVAHILHGGCLSTEDVEQVKLLIHEFCTRALLPYIEKQVQQLNDNISNKKGVSRSLFSATKRWFTPSKPGSNNMAINMLIYSSDAPELQIRKLGDLYFMFGHYSLAFQSYHSAKRDFHADQAWLYYAGALEMAALAAFMANESSRKTCDYMEESISTYLNTCKMAQFAARATLLSLECLKGRSLYGEAAHQLIRMTSEESDLRSALLLEQASFCFLNCTRPYMVRKYAFHMVLAGHRFSKAGQRKHSLRCYKQAFEVYKNRGWNLAEDHVHFTIGRQASNLNQLKEASTSFSTLLTAQSKQSPQQQSVFLNEYLSTQGMLLKDEQDMEIILPLPILNSESIKVLVGPRAPLTTPGKIPADGINLSSHTDAASLYKWNKLEEMLVQDAQGSLPMIFKPLVTLHTNNNVSNINPIAVIGEPIHISVEVYNPLYILLNIKDIYLLCNFKSKNSATKNEITSSSVDDAVKTHSLKSVILQPNSSQELHLSVTPLLVGELYIRGICYGLSNSTSTEEQINVKGKQLFNIVGPKPKTKDKNLDIRPDTRLHIEIVPSAPCLQVSFSEISPEPLCNEVQQLSIEMRNIGCVPVHKIYMATSMPHLISTCELKTDENLLDDSDLDIDNPAVRERLGRRNHVTSLPLLQQQLEPGQCSNVSIWLRAPEVKGPKAIELLIYCENVDSTSIPRYRLVRHTWNFSVQDSIKVNVSSQRSSNSRDVDQLSLSVKAVNLNRVHDSVLTEIVLLKAALLSTNWLLLDHITAPASTKLQSQESAYVLLKARRKVNKQNNYSEVSFSTNQPVQNLSCAYLDFAKRSETCPVNVFNELDSTRTCQKREGTLILRWQALVTDSSGNKKLVSGQHYVPIHLLNKNQENCEQEGFTASFDPSHKIELETSKKGDESLYLSQKQVTYSILHPVRLNHDFQKNKLCIVPVKLMLHSSAETELVISVNTSVNGGKSLHCPRPMLQPYSSKYFRWIGRSTTVRLVAPLSTDCVHLCVGIFKPGTYDLGARLEVWCHTMDEPNAPVLQVCRVQSALIVASGKS